MSERVTWYHGTNASLALGDLIEPRDGQAWFTRSRRWAAVFAADRAWRRGGEPHVYEVLPSVRRRITGWGTMRSTRTPMRIEREHGLTPSLMPAVEALLAEWNKRGVLKPSEIFDQFWLEGI